MRTTKLILIDGLPGSGKTTTALALAAWMRQQGGAAQCVLETAAEGHDHPLNVGGPLHPAGHMIGADLFRHYTVEAYMAESLRRWRAFVDRAACTDAVQIVESYPYQNAVRILLQMDASTAALQAYVAALERIVQPMQAVLVYFEHADAAHALQTIAAERGPDWTAYAIAVVTTCPYARRRGLHGFDGALTLMRAYKALLDELRGASALPVLVLAECRDQWARCEQRLREFLDL